MPRHDAEREAWLRAQMQRANGAACALGFDSIDWVMHSSLSEKGFGIFAERLDPGHPSGSSDTPSCPQQQSSMRLQ